MPEPYLDGPLHVSENRRFHLRSSCNGFGIERGECEGKLRFLLLIVQARRFFYEGAPAAYELIVALILTKTEVKYEEKSDFSSFSSSFLPER